MKTVIRFFLSLRTTFGVFLAFIVLAFAGSLTLVRHLAFFSGIDDLPLFQWLSGAKGPGKTWWIYLLIAVLALLAVNTVFCTADGLLRKIGGKNLILKLSPQVMHFGVLVIMLGHLITASIGFKTDISVGRGEQKAVSGNYSVSVEDVRVETDEKGYDAGWDARVLWFEAGRKTGEGILRPVHPLYFGLYGVYAKAVTGGPDGSVLIRVSRDPGALWALIGGIVLAFGGIGFLYGRLQP